MAGLSGGGCVDREAAIRGQAREIVQGMVALESGVEPRQQGLVVCLDRKRMVKVQEVSEEKDRAVRAEADKAGGKSVVVQRLRLNEHEKNVNRALLPVPLAADVIYFCRHGLFSFLGCVCLCPCTCTPALRREAG